MKKIFLMFLISILLVSCTSANSKNGKVNTNQNTSDISISQKIKSFKVENLQDDRVVYSEDIIDKNRPTLLVMVAEWCPYCKAELVEIEKFYTEYKDKINVVVIYSNDRSTKMRSRNYNNSNNFSFNSYFDKNNEAYVHFLIKKYPSNFLIQNGTFIKLVNPVNYEKLVNLFK